MVSIDRVWLFPDLVKDNKMRVWAKFPPFGEFHVDVELPQAFKDSLMNMAVKAAALHHEKMRAQVLGENDAKERSEQKAQPVGELDKCNAGLRDSGNGTDSDLPAVRDQDSSS